MEFGLLGLASLYSAYAFSVAYYLGKRPMFMSFPTFKAVCRFGEKGVISDNMDDFGRLFRLAFNDLNYQQWMEVVRSTDLMTQSEWLAFNVQRNLEVNAELKKRNLG